MSSSCVAAWRPVRAALPAPCRGWLRFRRAAGILVGIHTNGPAESQEIILHMRKCAHQHARGREQSAFREKNQLQKNPQP